MQIVREIGAGSEGSSCLVLPSITHVEFTTFHNALFAAENDESLDFFTLIKVAEAIGAELVSTRLGHLLLGLLLAQAYL